MPRAKSNPEPAAPEGAKTPAVSAPESVPQPLASVVESPVPVPAPVFTQEQVQAMIEEALANREKAQKDEAQREAVRLAANRFDTTDPRTNVRYDENVVPDAADETAPVVRAAQTRESVITDLGNGIRRVDWK